MGLLMLKLLLMKFLEIYFLKECGVKKLNYQILNIRLQIYLMMLIFKSIGLLKEIMKLQLILLKN